MLATYSFFSLGYNAMTSIKPMMTELLGTLTKMKMEAEVKIRVETDC
jgi:hypothetical protein